MTNYQGEVALAVIQIAGCSAIVAGGCLALIGYAFAGRTKPQPVAEPEPEPRFYADRSYDRTCWTVRDRREQHVYGPCEGWDVAVRTYSTRRAAMLGAKRLNDRAKRGAPYLPESLR